MMKRLRKPLEPQIIGLNSTNTKHGVTATDMSGYQIKRRTETRIQLHWWEGRYNACIIKVKACMEYVERVWSGSIVWLALGIKERSMTLWSGESQARRALPYMTKCPNASNLFSDRASHINSGAFKILGTLPVEYSLWPDNVSSSSDCVV